MTRRIAITITTIVINNTLDRLLIVSHCQCLTEAHTARFTTQGMQSPRLFWRCRFCDRRRTHTLQLWRQTYFQDSSGINVSSLLSVRPLFSEPAGAERASPEAVRSSQSRLYCTILYCTIIYYTIPHYTLVYYTKLYCTILHAILC